MALGIVAARRQIDSGNGVNALVCIGFASLLAFRISWTHHWVWAVVALLVLVQGQRWVAAVVRAAVLVIGPMWFTPRGGSLELRLVADRGMRLIRGDRACLPGLLCLDSPTFKDQLSLLSAIGRTGHPGLTPSG